MRIRHILSTGSARQEVEGNRSIFLRSPESYLALNTVRNSRYDGWFIDDTRAIPSTFTKLLESITYIKGDDGVAPEAVGITTTEDAAFWEYGDGAKLGFQVTPEHAGLLVRASRASRLRIVLDIRNTYSAPQFGRDYAITRVAGGLVIRYSDTVLSEPVYLHIATPDFIDLTPQWYEVQYPWDTARRSDPSALHVYTLGEVTTEQLCFGAGSTAEAAQLACKAAAKLPLETVGIGISYSEDSLANTIDIAKKSAERALHWLQSPHGIYAGLPWFHQVWSRDELIAALGCSAAERREIIQRYLSSTTEQGELPTFIGSGTTCADGLGWLCLLLREHGLQDLSTAGQSTTTSFLLTAYAGLQVRRSEHGLILSGHNATWMDTIGREGYRIEIQCMYALLLELLGELTGETRYAEEKTAFLATVREHFFHDDYLYDGLGDATKRPNVFLAYLLQPELLAEAEWRSCFSVILAACGTTWGGLTSLDSSHPAFQAESTGQDNLSYHNGDSWFFVNNLAATALARYNPKEYQEAILQILTGSTEEILWKNMLGQPGEIASAKSGASWGCGIQAFSAGAYLLLLTELGY